MKILVTGGAGFIGSHIVDALVAAGHTVAVIDNLSSGKRENLNTKAAFYHIDIRDKAVSDVFAKEKPDVLCHQAAQVSVRYSVTEPCADADINIVGTLNLIENCRAHGVERVTFASSGGAIYGEQDFFPADESHAFRPVSPYGTAKLAVEFYMGYYRQVFGLSYAALRYSNVYGPRQDPHGEAGVVAIFVGLMLDGKVPTINGDGGQTRDYVFVKDVVAANVAAIESEVVGGFNIGTGVETTVNGLYDVIKAKTGYPGGSIHGPAKTGEQYRSVLDAKLAGKSLGWSPKTSLEDGIEDTVAFFRKGR